MVAVSVIIVSYNTEDLLSGCLSSVQASLDASGLESEVIVVDNASSDGSTDMVERSFPQVKLIRNTTNAGFAAASNQGIREAHGDYLFLLNPDAEVRGKGIAQLASFLDEHRDVGVVNPKLLNGDGSFQHSAFHFPTLLMSFFDFFLLNHRVTNSRLNGRYPVSAYRAPFEIDHPLGAAFMVRRKAIEQAGLVDEAFFMYCEEIDWCLRIKRAGWRIFCQPKAEVIHYGAQSTSQFWGPMFVELHRGRLRLFRKHCSPLFRLLNRQIIRLGISSEMRKAESLYSKKAISESEFEERRKAYKEILDLVSRDAHK